MSGNTPTVGRQPTDEQLSLDDIYELLSARRRRYVLYCLYRNKNPIRLPDLADRVTEWEQEGTSHEEDRLQTYNSLYHCHIPQLAEAAVVSYSQENDLVELAENAPKLRPYLEQAAERDLTPVDIQCL